MVTRGPRSVFRERLKVQLTYVNLCLRWLAQCDQPSEILHWSLDTTPIQLAQHRK